MWPRTRLYTEDVIVVVDEFEQWIVTLLLHPVALSNDFTVHLVEMNNSIEKFKQETDNSIDEKVDIREKHAELKKVYKDLKHSYNSLKEMTEDQTRQPQQLKDLRVRELWRLAQTSNMTGDELSSFKARLSHTSANLHR